MLCQNNVDDAGQTSLWFYSNLRVDSSDFAIRAFSSLLIRASVSLKFFKMSLLNLLGLLVPIFRMLSLRLSQVVSLLDS